MVQNLNMAVNKFIIPLIIVIGILFTGCGINSNLMFRTPKDFKGYDSIPMSPAYEYQISADDRLELKIYTNNGEKLIDFVSGGNSDASMSRATNTNLDYLVKKDGYVELPIIGDVKLNGVTLREAQNILKEHYQREYENPFIQLRVINQRAIVFPGSGSEARVVPLLNSNTTLMETLALAGGITERGRSKHIKVMRQTPKGREIYLIDLSTLDGLYYADMVVQANDYIYVEPVKQIGKEVIKDVAPIISILTSAIIIVTVITTLK